MLGERSFNNLLLRFIYFGFEPCQANASAMLLPDDVEAILHGPWLDIWFNSNSWWCFWGARLVLSPCRATEHTEDCNTISTDTCRSLVSHCVTNGRCNIAIHSDCSLLHCRRHILVFNQSFLRCSLRLALGRGDRAVWGNIVNCRLDQPVLLSP